MKEEEKVIRGQFKKRLQIVYSVIFLIGIACVISILNLGIRKRALYNGSTKYCYDKTLPDSLIAQQPHFNDSTCTNVIFNDTLKPVRGEIYDCKGRILAGNSYAYELKVFGSRLRNTQFSENKKEKKSDDYVPSMNDSIRINNKTCLHRSDTAAIKKEIHKLAIQIHKQLSNRFKGDIKSYEDRLTRAILKHQDVIIKSSLKQNERYITKEDIAFFDSLNIIGYKQGRGNKKIVGYPAMKIRIYPYGEMAKRLVGNCPQEKQIEGGRRPYGLEYYFDSTLTGNTGVNKILKTSNINLPLGKGTEPRDGLNVYTTIDLDIQDIVHESLMDKMKELGAEWGCAVVMECATGEIRGISNLGREKIDEKQFEYTEQLNYALRKSEPGSTFKLAALLTYLDRVTEDTAKSYYTCGCELRKYNIHARFKECNKTSSNGTCSKSNAMTIFEKSSNEGISAMIFDCFGFVPGKYKKAEENYIAALDSMYIIQPLDAQLELLTPTINRNPKEFNPTQFYTYCFGGGIDLAPIQTLTYYNAIANNGKMVAPLFVKEIKEETKTIKTFSSKVIKEMICKSSSVKKAQNYLRQVVIGEHGTARRFRNNPITFAGKTGTRDARNEETHSYISSSNNISFCGYFPYENPKYSCIIYIGNAGLVPSSQATEVFVNICNGISDLESISSARSLDSTWAHTGVNARTTHISDVKDILENWGETTTLKKIKNTQHNYVKTTSSGEWKVVEITKENILNHVVGMTPSDAIYELSKLGYETIIQGYGYVSEAILKDEKVLLILKSG